MTLGRKRSVMLKPLSKVTDTHQESYSHMTHVWREGNSVKMPSPLAPLAVEQVAVVPHQFRAPWPVTCLCPVCLTSF